MPELEVKCYIWGRAAHSRCKTWNILLLSYINISRRYFLKARTPPYVFSAPRYLRAGRGVRPNKSPTDTRLIATSVSAAFPRNFHFSPASKLPEVDWVRSRRLIYQRTHQDALCGVTAKYPLALSSNGHLYARYVKVSSLCGFNWEVNYVGEAHGGVFGAWDCGRPGQRWRRPGNSGFRVPSLLKNLYIGIWQIPPDSAPKLSWQKTGLI